MFAPGVPQVMEEFKSTSVELSAFVVSIYILGYAFGPLITAPLSEIYGRLPLYHSSSILFILFNVACAKSNSFSVLVVFRFLSGLVGSCPITIGSGSIADCFSQEKRGMAISLWTLPSLLGPTLGPVAGGYLSEAAGWRWTFWLLVILNGAILVPGMLFLQETYPPVILERRVHRLRKETGNKDLRSALQSTKNPTQLFIVSILRPAKSLIFSPIVLVLSIFIALCYGYLYLVLTTMTEVFEEQYGISTGNVGLTYLGIGLGNFIGLFAIAYVSDRILKHMANGGELKPEYRLPPILPAAFMMPIGLLWYGWSIEYKVHWIIPVIGSVFLGIGMLGVAIPIGTYLVDAYTIYAASAMAANTVLRSMGGGLLPLCGQKM